MSEDLLDDNVQYARFKKPVTLLVNKEAWLGLCDELQGKAAKGTFIFIAISIVISIFTFGMLLFVAALGIGIFINVGIRRRFNYLKTLADHSYVISNNQVIDIFEGEKQIIPFSKIKDIEFHNWGVDVDTKANRKMADRSTNDGRIMIPRTINDYGRVIATFEYLKKQM